MASPPKSVFTFTTHFPSCHAATVVELATNDLLAAWFAGTHEGHADVGIWLSHFDGHRWGEAVLVADVSGVPLWNPVLFRDADDIVWLFYKAGPSVPAWAGLYMTSQDGAQWTPPRILPAGLLGPVRNKPILLSNGDILCGSSCEVWQTWACWVEISSDGGRTWSRRGPIEAPGGGRLGQSIPQEPVSATWDTKAGALALPKHFPGVIQPTVWEYEPGRLKMLMRSTLAIGRVCQASSEDYGRTWSPAATTDIANPNSAVDAVRLADGRIVLACNPTHEGRTPLSLLISEDNGGSWMQQIDLETEPGEYSYPSIIQASDGMIHLVYTYRRQQIRHRRFSPGELNKGQLTSFSRCKEMQ